MASPTNDPFNRSAIEKFTDSYKNQAAANRNDGYFKVPDRTPSPVAQTPNPTGSLADRKQLTGSYYNPAANGNDGYFKTPNRTPPPPPAFEPPKPQKVSNSYYQRELRNQQGLTQGRALNDNPGFRNPNPTSLADRMNIPTSAGGKGLSGLAPLLKGSGPGFGIGLGLTVLPGVLQQGGNYFNPSNPNGIFAPDPRVKEIERQNEQTKQGLRDALKNMGVPEWLNPFKDFKPGESPSLPGEKPNAESRKWFPSSTDISFYSPNNRQYLTLSVLSYSIESLPKYNQGTEENPNFSARFSGNVYLREGKDDYLIRWRFFESFNPVKISSGDTRIEPWTLQDLGPSIGNRRNPEDPSNIVPETGKPFFPPAPEYPREPPTILDPNDFKPQTAKPPLSPRFPPTLEPIPKPLDPLQKPSPPLAPGTQPTKPSEDEKPKVPPFNPLQPPANNPTQNPPTFEPGPANPNQRLNDRGIFPARQADVTATASGSPLSPDVEIGGDPVRLKPAPTITKPKPPFETDEEKKRKEEEKKASQPFPLPLIPPVFPRPAGPTGNLDPGTADDITKSKDPPKPPTGTGPKCQDPCMARLETGQQSILEKMGGSGINTTLNAGQALLLETINNKMGPQLPGGLAGKLGRLSEWLHLDRALNMMTFATTLHNAYFLSSGLTQTLFSMISNVLAAGGIKDDEKNPLDIGAILGKQVDGYAKSVLGVATVDGIKAEWKKYSRIYQAASNLLFSIQSIGQSILGALEMVGSQVAKIGNALQKFGVISEKAFGWMNQSPNYQNRFFTTIEKVEEVTSNIDSIAGEVLSVQDTITQIGTQKKELEDAAKQAEGSKQGKESPEAATIKAAQEKIKTDSNPPTIPVTAERKPEA
ncbi:MAG: hypothetical protein LH702_11490 [Phormidesmis sp. CAN_BIN44]|nr:hypothetical protein [Phormidesmis sp. CAN_BIN44]